MSRLSWRVLCVVTAVILLSPSAARAQIPDQEDTGSLRTAGDIIHLALPSAAATAAVLNKDWKGLLQFGFSFGATVGTFNTVKAAVEKNRPDVADARSFPSGHTAMSFSGASFIHRRYGKEYGIPALVAASFVGYTRIRGEKHFADDVIAGAGIGLLYNWWLTKPQNRDVQIQPISHRDGFGLQLAIDLNGTDELWTKPVITSLSEPRPLDDPQFHAAPPSASEDHKYRLEFEYGAVDFTNLDVQAPKDLGTPLSLEERESNVTATARVAFDWKVRPRHEVGAYWAPLEARDFGLIPSTDTVIGGVTFPAGVESAVRARFDTIGARYRYSVWQYERAELSLGGGFHVRDSTITALQEDNDLFVEVNDIEVIPLAHGRFYVGFTEQVGVNTEFDWIALTNGAFNSSVYTALKWAPSQRWDFNFGFRRQSRRTETAAVRNRFIFNYFLVGIGYSL